MTKSKPINLAEDIDINQQYLKNVIENLPEYIYWKDKNLLYQGSNKHIAQYLKLSSPEEIIGKTDYDFGWSDERIHALEAIDREVLEKGHSIVVEDIIPNPDGSESVMLSSKSPMYSQSGEIIGILGVSTDITLQKDLEKKLSVAKDQAEAANQAKSNFLASISHELRTPLNGILGISDMLSRQGLTSKQKAMLGNIIASGKNLLALVNDILDFSKLEAGKFVLSVKPFAMDKLLKGVYTDMSHLINQPNLKLTVHCDSAIPEYLMGDALRIRQILINLVNNAIKFTKAGTISVTANCETIVNNMVTLYITVIDTGIGIREDKLDSIFERFTQVEADESEYQRQYGGTGLGLSICRHLIETMNGKMGVESEFGKGSTFWLRVPFAVSSVDVAIPLEMPEIILEPFSNPHHILIVEDEIINQFVAMGMLEELGCTYDLAETGLQAIELFEKNAHRYQLIFMDIRLPDMTGVVVAQKLQAMRETHAQPPIVAMTAHAFDEEIAKFSKAGMLEVITKPVERIKLYNVLRKYLEET
jgi:two-component system, OmpR family, aerobic respiration control sensor histidine kinase ArcB